jgi:8-oxo-dGTP pyrophosphatase MutT (NUDIX family)
MRCDNTSVGVVIADGQGRLLLFERVRPPWGIAPVAGHVDDHGSVDDAARAEVAEEVGLTVVRLQYLLSVWRGNACRRLPGPEGVGHHWSVFRADAVGDLRPAVEEVRRPFWCDPARLQGLSDRTVGYANGDVSAAQFAADPGIDPVWVGLFHAVGLVDVSVAELAAADRIAQQPEGSQ